MCAEKWCSSTAWVPEQPHGMETHPILVSNGLATVRTKASTALMTLYLYIYIHVYVCPYIVVYVCVYAHSSVCVYIHMTNSHSLLSDSDQ